MNADSDQVLIGGGERVAGARSLRYRLLMSTAGFIVFCSFIPSFLFLTGWTAINPGRVVVAYFVVVAALWLVMDRKLEARASLTYAWAAFFVALNLLTATIHGFGDEFYQRVAGALSLWILASFCLTTEISGRALQRFLLAFVLVNASFVAFDFFFPGYFVPADHEFFNPGRGAGVFVNANKSGIAAVFALVLLMLTPRNRLFRLIFLLTTLWLLLTLSRSALVGYFAVCLVALVTRKLRLHDLALPAAAGVALAAAAIGWTLVQGSEGIDSISERLAWAASPSKVRDDAGIERVVAARNAVEIVAASPLIGQGFGAVNAAYGLPPHNLFLQFAADYGVIGIVAIVGLMFCMYVDWRRAGSPPELRAAVFAWIACFGIFSFFYDEAVGVTEFIFVAALLQRCLGDFESRAVARAN